MVQCMLIAVAAALVNNVVLSQFLGLCPFLGVSKKTDTAAGMGAEELAEKLKTSCEDTLSVTGIHKDGVIVKNIQELSGNALIKEIMNADIEIASFDSYRPSLNDIFVKAVGGDR